MISEYASELRKAERLGAEQDQPEGSRYVRISDTLVNRIADELDRLFAEQYRMADWCQLGIDAQPTIDKLNAEIEHKNKLLTEAATWIHTEIEASEVELPDAIDLVDRILEELATKDSERTSKCSRVIATVNNTPVLCEKDENHGGRCHYTFPYESTYIMSDEQRQVLHRALRTSVKIVSKQTKDSS